MSVVVPLGALVAPDVPTTAAGTGGNDTIAPGGLSAGATGTAPGPGLDVIGGTTGSDLIDGGGGGSDAIVYFGLPEGTGVAVVFDAATRTATAAKGGGAAGTDTLLGGASDRFYGSQAADSFTVLGTAAGAHPPLLLALELGAGDDTVDGGALTRAVEMRYLLSPAGVVVDLAAGTAQDGWGGTDRLAHVWAVHGSDHADTVLGSGAEETFSAGSGDDTYDGRGGFDRLSYFGLAGVTVTLTGIGSGTAAKTLAWQPAGTDAFAGIERIEGSTVDDTLIGTDATGPGAVFLRGGAGNDRIDGRGNAANVADYGDAFTGVVVDLAAGTAQDGQFGTDTLVQVRAVRGSIRGDTLIGSAGDDLLQGEAGDDLIDGGGGGGDRASFRGSRGDFQVTAATGGGFVVRDLRAYGDGTDTVRGVELFEFDDGVATGATLLSPRTALGQQDFGGDGRADILWRHADGRAGIWQVEGGAASGGALAADPTAYWAVAGTGDFDGNGRSDILWRGQGGEVAVWRMDGAQVVGGGWLSADPNSYWSIAGTGDFDGDGRSDILWRGRGGEVAVWTMNGAAVTGSRVLSANPTSYWAVAGTGDFDGDGHSEILWRGRGGEVAVWRVDGATASGGALAVNPTSYWSVADTGDFDGDGRSDILWRGADGRVVVWGMNGAAVTGVATLGTLAGEWQVVSA